MYGETSLKIQLGFIYHTMYLCLWDRLERFNPVEKQLARNKALFKQNQGV